MRKSTAVPLYLAAILSISVLSRTVLADSVSAWGIDTFSQVAGAPTANNFAVIGAGFVNGIAITSTGSLVAWGDGTYGQTNVPSGNNFVAVAAGSGTLYALTSSGSIVAWGRNNEGEVSNAPAGNNFTAIAAYFSTAFGLTSSGSVVAWGYDGSGQVSGAPSGNNFTAISANSQGGFALRTDGSIASWGTDFNGSIEVPAGNNYVAIATAGNWGMALTNIGTIVVWGDGSQGQYNVPVGNTYVALAASDGNGYARTSDGRLVVWGSDRYGNVSGAPHGSNISAIAAGGSTGYALTFPAPLPSWRALQGLAADGSQDLENPSGDGIPNLAKFAFNLAPNAGALTKPNYQTLTPNGSAGLPLITVDNQGRLVIQFIRRKASTNPGIAYVVETGTDLVGWNALDLNNASIVSIDSTWERLTVADPAVTPKRFGRVRITSLGVFYDDFNLGLGPTALNGSAIFVNQAVQLTSGITRGQVGAAIFNGVNVTPQLTGFTANFNLSIGSTSTPADGVSFAVGTLPSIWGESGPLTSHSIAVGFDTYDNGGTGSIGIHVWVNGAHLTANPTDPYTNGSPVPVQISYDQGSGLTVKYNGATIFSNIAVTGFNFQAGDQFGIGARTGGSVEKAVVDDVQIAPH